MSENLTSRYFEYDNLVSIIDELISFFPEDSPLGRNSIVLLNSIKKYLRELVRKTDFEDISVMGEMLNSALFALKQNVNPNDQQKNLSSEVYREARKIIRSCYNNVLFFYKKDKFVKPEVVNSEGLYKDLIQSAQNQIANLSKEISDLQRDRASLAVNKKLLQEKEEELIYLKKQLIEYKEQEEAKKRRDDAVVTWNTNIKEAFKNLNENISPLKTEHKRLKLLYRTYNTFSIISILLLIIIEIIVCSKIHSAPIYPSVVEYLSLILPVPVTIGLLCGFVTQSNRAQRQMVVLSKFIHDIQYTEGILLAINNLTTNVADSSLRINNALDKLLDKHLSHDMWSIDNEYLIIKEENKDTLPYDTLSKVIDVIRKSK